MQQQQQMAAMTKQYQQSQAKAAIHSQTSVTQTTTTNHSMNFVYSGVAPSMAINPYQQIKPQPGQNTFSSPPST